MEDAYLRSIVGGCPFIGQMTLLLTPEKRPVACVAAVAGRFSLLCDFWHGCCHRWDVRQTPETGKPDGHQATQ